MPKVSVIIPNYNHAPYLRQRIDSVLDQTYQDFELILLDDCSTDNSRTILAEYKQNPKVSHCILNEKNSGSTFRQWNKGVELAQGDYIWIAESDDRAEVNFLEVMVHEFEQRPQVGLIYAGSKLLDGNGEISYMNESGNTGDRIQYSHRIDLWPKFSVSNPIWNASAMMFKRSLYPSLMEQNLFSNMRYCGDWFFYVLIAEKGVDFLEIKQTLNNFRVHHNNVSTGAMSTGMTFLEGLDVYSYLKPKLLWTETLKASKNWAQNYCRQKRRQHYSKETQQQVVDKMKQNHILIWFFYHIFNMYYRFKSKR